MIARTREQRELSARRFPGWHAVSFNPPRASRRAMALSHAAACRELWRAHHEMTTPDLQTVLQLHEFHLSGYCRPRRSDHLRRVSRWYVRMIRTELRKREIS